MQFKFPMAVTNSKGRKITVPTGTEFTYESFELGDTTIYQWSTIVGGETFTHECRARPVKTVIHEHGFLN